MKKKYINLLIIIVVVVFIATIGILFLNDKRNLLWINWNIHLEKPNKVEIIYNFDGRDGEDIEIWHYEKKDLDKITKMKNAIKLTKDNINEVTIKLEEFYNVLQDNAKENFDSNIFIKKIIKENNYYIYLTKDDDERTYLLLIIDCETNKMYYFNNVY